MGSFSAKSSKNSKGDEKRGKKGLCWEGKGAEKRGGFNAEDAEGDGEF